MRSEHGFTLVEVLAAMTVGLVLLGATLGLMESTVRLNTGVMAKTDAMQRGRLAMDTLTQQLRSQVCLDVDTSAVIEGSDGNSVTFYSDFSEGDVKPFKRKLVFDPATGHITSLRYDQQVNGTYSDTATATNLVLENATLQRDPDDATKTIPFVRYYRYEEDDGGILRPETEITAPLDEDEAEQVALLELTFVSHPTGSGDGKKAVALTDQVVARHTDPNSGPNPACV